MRLLARQFRQFHRADEGQALVLISLSLAVLLLMAGLGVDVAYLRYQKQQMQTAADAGALAGAATLIYNGNWHAAAVADVSANGFRATNGNGVTVLVDKPWEGSYAGQDGYVEVSVSQPQPTFFMRVGGYDSAMVRSWSVASSEGSASACIYALDPADSGSFLVDGNPTITSTCGIFINSNSTTALVKNGVSGSVSASYVGIVGNESQGDLVGVVSKLSPNQQPVTGMAPFTDPLAGVPAPTYNPHCDSGHTNYTVNGDASLTAGTYCGGITLKAHGTVTFGPGLYVLLGGGLTVKGASTLISDPGGVTFYFTGTPPTYSDYAGISMHGSETASLSAPTDSSNGGIPGILFFQDRAVPTTASGSTFGGASGTGYTGAMYFPTTAITYKGNPSLAATATIIVGYTLDFRGDTNIENYTLINGAGPIRSAVMAQ